MGAKNRIFGVLPKRKMEREPKMKYVGGRGKGKKLSFLPSPPYPPSFTRSIFALLFFAPGPDRNACYAGYAVHLGLRSGVRYGKES